MDKILFVKYSNDSCGVIDELSFNTLILDIKVIISYLNNQFDNDLLNLIDNDKPSLALIYKNKYLKNIPISIQRRFDIYDDVSKNPKVSAL